MAAILPAVRSHLVEFVAKMQRKRSGQSPKSLLHATEARAVSKVVPPRAKFLFDRIALAQPRARPLQIRGYGATSGASSRLKAAMIAGIGCGIGGTS